MPSILEMYAGVTVASFIVLSFATGSPILALFICGWVGLFTAIFVNEVTPGYTME